MIQRAKLTGAKITNLILPKESSGNSVSPSQKKLVSKSNYCSAYSLIIYSSLILLISSCYYYY